MNFTISDVFSATLQIRAWKTTQNPANRVKNAKKSTSIADQVKIAT